MRAMRAGRQTGRRVIRHEKRAVGIVRLRGAGAGKRCKVHDRFYEQEVREAEVAERLKGLEEQFGLDAVIEGGLMFGLGPTKGLLARREEMAGQAAG